MLANADHPLATPLERWPVGEVVQDVHVVELPQGAGDLRVLLGFWHDDQRLPVDAPAPQDGTQRMVGPLIRGAPGVPEIHVRRTASAPRIDGVLDDAAWSAAAPLTLVDSLDGSKPELRTIARLSWDDAGALRRLRVRGPRRLGNPPAAG